MTNAKLLAILAFSCFQGCNVVKGFTPIAVQQSHTFTSNRDHLSIVLDTEGKSNPRSTSFRLGQTQNDADEPEPNSNYLAAFGAVGILAQPVVWTSLYSVITTGGGLPAGPFGLIGAFEGISYLIVVALAARSVIVKKDQREDYILLDYATKSSNLALIAGLVALIVVSSSRGCVPNAKPILDYSAYLPVCKPNDGTSLFGP